MNKFRNVFSIYLTIGLMMFGFAAQANAQNNRNQQDVRVILRNLGSEMDDFRYRFDSEISRASINRNDKNAIVKDVKNLEDAISEFEGKFQRGRESSQDVSDILDEAKSVNDFVYLQRSTQNIQSDWLNVRNLLDRLAANYSVYPNWNNNNNSNNNTTYYPNTSSTNNVGLTGTYDLDRSKSDNTSDIFDNANIQNDDQRRDLEEKLEPAEQVAIALRGNQAIIASSKSAPISLTTDGRDRNVTLANGTVVKVRATLRGQDLTVASRDNNTDYTVTYSPQDNGNSLKVTRRITTDYLSQTVFAESFYGKTDQVARLGIDTNSDVYSSNDQDDNTNTNTNTNTSRTGDFIVPSGTIITGTLENDISTKVSQNNDRFRMVVQEPNQYRGSIIEGYISGINRSGKVTGRSKITFNFERIRLQNGETYDFAGILQTVTDAEGKVVKVDTEGVAKGGSQTKTTATRGAIGAGIGAIIGAIAGGGKGAAIGAIIGGGAGAGSVVLTGKDDLELKQGSAITVQSTSPR